MLCGILQIAQTLAKFVGSGSPSLINIQYNSCNIQGVMTTHYTHAIDLAYLHLFAVLVTKRICISYLSCRKITVQIAYTHIKENIVFRTYSETSI